MASKKDVRTKPGFYLDLEKGEFIHPGERDAGLTIGDRLVKVPAVLVVIAAPLISLAYVVFLPAAGLAGSLVFIVRKLRDVVFAAGRKPGTEQTLTL